MDVSFVVARKHETFQFHVYETYLLELKSLLRLICFYRSNLVQNLDKGKYFV